MTREVTIIQTPIGSVLRIGSKSDLPLLFEYGGKIYATNLFKMHDEAGFSLTDSIIECRNRGWLPCCDQFICDAMKAGWPKERATKMVESAMNDAQSTCCAT